MVDIVNHEMPVINPLPPRLFLDVSRDKKCFFEKLFNTEIFPQCCFKLSNPLRQVFDSFPIVLIVF